MKKFLITIMGMKTVAFKNCKISKEAENLNRQKGTCMRCYNMEVLYVKMYRFLSEETTLCHMSTLE